MTKTQIGRIAIREIRGEVRAYFALHDTMKGAVWLGSIPLAVARMPSVFAAWQAVMRDVVSDILEKQYGERPTWPTSPAPAPEHERGVEPWGGDA